MDYKFLEKLKKIFMYFSIFILIFIAIVFLVTNNILLFLLIFTIIILFSIKFKIKKFPLWLFIISLIIRILVILILDYPQVYDFKILLDASNAFSLDDYSFSSWGHFAMWGYQTGFVIYQGILLKIFNSELVLKILNAIYSSGLVLIIYYVGKNITNEKSAKVASLLYMIFPFPLFLNTILANHHLATILTYIGILFLLKKDRKFKDYILGGVFIAFGNIIRPEGIIVVFSYFLYELFQLKKGKIFDSIKKFGVFILVYLIINNGASFLVQLTSINPIGLSNTNPLWKFVVGLNYDTCGYYSEDDVIYQDDEQKELEIIKERISNPVQVTKLLVCKTEHFWLQTDISSETGAFTDKQINIFGYQIKFADLENIVFGFNTCLYITVFALCLLGIIIKRKAIIHDKSFFFVIMMIVTFFVYLLIEIQPRYAYFIHISIFILATYGIEYIFDKIEQIKFNHK